MSDKMSVEYLLNHSNLPGPRGNLELLHRFIAQASEQDVSECLAYDRPDLKNCPEEFVVMCGVAGLCILKRLDLNKAIQSVRAYASHQSWRIRESVAIGIQEIAEGRIAEIIDEFAPWTSGNPLEKRAVVAALCEPKLLKDKKAADLVVKVLSDITQTFIPINAKLTDELDSLRKALGYGWSVAVAALPEEGKNAFEALLSINNKHIQWIVKENLNKNRLLKMDKAWVDYITGKLPL